MVFGRLTEEGFGADVTSVKCKEKGLPIGNTVEAITSLVLTIDQLASRMGRPDCQEREGTGASRR